jgi:hypothetical protein
MFTADDLISLIEAEIDDDMDTIDVVQNVNACLLEHCEDFRKTATQTVVVSDSSSWAARTDGHLAVVKITAGGENWTGEWELSYDRTQIRIGEAGSFVVTSIIIPPYIAAVGENISVNDVFKLGIAKYIGACFKLKDDDTNQDGLRIKSEAIGLIKKAAALLISSDKRPGGRIPAMRSAGNWRNP